MPVLRCLCVVVLAVGLSGCGDTSGLVPVTGTVTLDDQPLANALVTFYPEGDTAGLGGFGMTGPDGKYTLTPTRPGSLPPGEYVIVVSRRLRPDGSPPPPDVPPIESDARETLPRGYTDRATTDQRAKVSKETASYEIKLRAAGPK